MILTCWDHGNCLIFIGDTIAQGYLACGDVIECNLSQEICNIWSTLLQRVHGVCEHDGEDAFFKFRQEFVGETGCHDAAVAMSHNRHVPGRRLGETKSKISAFGIRLKMGYLNLKNVRGSDGIHKKLSKFSKINLRFSTTQFVVLSERYT